jgi:hypothetical protein
MISPSVYKKIIRAMLLIPVAVLIAGGVYFYIYRNDYFVEHPGDGIAYSAVILAVLLIYIALSRHLIKILDQNQLPNWKPISLHSLFAVISLAAIIYGSFMSYFPLAAMHYNTEPLLTWATDQDPRSSITIMWRTASLRNSIVLYGLSENNLDQNITIQESVEWHRVSLDGLTPNMRYYYQIAGTAIGKTYSFLTAPSTATNFTFVVMSDLRQNSGLEATLTQPNVPKYAMETLQKQGLQPAFTIICGDITRHALEITTWRSFFDDVSLSGLSTTAAVQISPGNHERGQNITGEIFADYFPYTNRPEFYYSFNYSSVHVLSLDPFNQTSGGWGTFSTTQLAWAENDLANCVNMPYVIVTLHPPPVDDNGVVEIYKPLVELCDKYNVDAVFFGHDHDFDVYSYNGTQYCLIGVGGNTGSDESEFVQVNVTSVEMVIQMQWVNGTTQVMTTISSESGH